MRPNFVKAVVMGFFTAYSIPVQGLKVGIHHYQYTLDGSFFSHFEDTPIEKAQVEVRVVLDKRHDMLLFDFSFGGSYETECDRCTAIIQLPLQDTRSLIVKYGDSEGEEDDEVVFVHRDAHDFNLAPYLYEFTILAMPLTNVYDCQNDEAPPCNQEILSRIQQDEKSQQDDSVWGDLLEKFDKNWNKIIGHAKS